MVTISVLSTFSFTPICLALLKAFTSDTMLVYLVSYFAAIWNPIVFVIFNSNFRKFLKKSLNSLKNICQKST